MNEEEKENNTMGNDDGKTLTDNRFSPGMLSKEMS